MDREEILKRSRASTEKDEGAQFAEMKSRRYGEIGLGIIFLALSIYKVSKGIPTNDILALMWGYLGLCYIYRYRFYKTKGALVSAVCGMIAAVAFGLGYILQTW